MPASRPPHPSPPASGADTLSDAERGILADLPARYPVSRIDRIWLFPARRLRDRDSGLLVLSLFPEDDEHGPRRLVVTLHYEAVQAPAGIRRVDAWAEQGWAPVERVPRLISGVLARLGDTAEPPHAAAIAGDPGRWAGFCLAPADELDPNNGE